MSNDRIKQYVLCDLDGTLCNLNHRLHFIKDGNKDWDSFTKASKNDLPYQDIVDLVEILDKAGFTILFVSGRTDTVFIDTLNWLNRYLRIDVTPEHLYMRKDKDYRPDHEVKREILGKLIERMPEGKRDIKYVIDDRDQVVSMWREEGLRCLQVANGDF